MTAVGGQIDELRGEPGTSGAQVSASDTVTAASSINTSAAKAETGGASNPAPAGEAAEE
jgi:hypothetical protein